MSERTVLIDGATGFVGSAFVARLVRDGCRVRVFARSSPDQVTAAVGSAARTGGASVDLSRLEVLPFSLTDPDLGLTPSIRMRAFAGIDSYWHFAASLQYRDSDRPKLWRTNVDGTVHALDVFRSCAPETAQFMYVSSAYSCGRTSGTVREAWHSEVARFRNPYEESKHAAEARVRAYVNDGVKAHVVRLAHIVGHSQTGRTTTGYGLYSFLKTLHLLGERHHDRSVRLLGRADASLNLVPIDHCVDWLSSLDTIPDLPSVVHVVDGTGFPVSVVAELVSTYLPITVRIVDGVGDDLDALERLLKARLAFEGQYLGERIRFDRQTLNRLIPQDSTMDLNTLDRLVRWYINRIASRGANIEE